MVVPIKKTIRRSPYMRGKRDYVQHLIKFKNIVKTKVKFNRIPLLIEQFLKAELERQQFSFSMEILL